MFVISRGAVKGEEYQPEHIKRSQQRGKKGDGPKHSAAVEAHRRLEQNLVFAKETGKQRRARDRQRGQQHGPVGPGDLFPQATHAAHVLLAAHGVNHAAGREEEQGLEKRVRHQVEDAGGESAYAAGQEHVPNLADGGIGQDTFDIGLHQANRGGVERRQAADNGHCRHGDRRVRVQDVRAGDHIHARGHHCRGVDQRADGRRPFHCVRQPDVERELCRFADGPGQQQQGDRSEHAGLSCIFYRHAGGALEHGGVVHRAKRPEDQQNAQSEAEVPNAGDDECLLASVGSALPQEEKPNQ